MLRCAQKPAKKPTESRTGCATRAETQQRAYQQLSLLGVDNSLPNDFPSSRTELSKRGRNEEMAGGGFELPSADNTPGAPALLRQFNQRYRQQPWPQPFDATWHRLHLGDARNLTWIADESIHLVVTSPP